MNKDTRELKLDTAFGINEAGTKGGGYAVVKVASGLNTEGDSSVAELYGVDVRSDGAVFIGCGNNRTNAVVLSADGAFGLGKLYDYNNDAWTPNGPIALVDDAYLGVMNNKYGGSQWAKGNMNVFNAQDLTQYTKQTYWEQLCWLEPYEKNVCYAMCYVGGNLYYTNVSNGNATDDYYSAGAGSDYRDEHCRQVRQKVFCGDGFPDLYQPGRPCLRSENDLGTEQIQHSHKPRSDSEDGNRSAGRLCGQPG